MGIKSYMKPFLARNSFRKEAFWEDVTLPAVPLPPPRSVYVSRHAFCSPFGGWVVRLRQRRLFSPLPEKEHFDFHPV